VPIYPKKYFLKNFFSRTKRLSRKSEYRFGKLKRSLICYGQHLLAANTLAVAASTILTKF
jgi:hypothetical protein